MEKKKWFNVIGNCTDMKKKNTHTETHINGKKGMRQ